MVSVKPVSPDKVGEWQGILFKPLLELLGKRLVAFRGDDGEVVDLEAFDALALLVDAEAEATTNGLAALLLVGHLAQGAYLEDVRVVPAFAESGVREEELQLSIEREGALCPS